MSQCPAGSPRIHNDRCPRRSVAGRLFHLHASGPDLFLDRVLEGWAMTITCPPDASPGELGALRYVNILKRAQPGDVVVCAGRPTVQIGETR
jgi:hypothetical protein